MTNRVVIGIGSNISPQANVAKAVELINSKFFIIAQSQFIRTKAIGRPELNDFLNGTVLVETHLDLYEMRAILKQMEEELGRARIKDPFGSRVIDLDLIVYNGQVIDEDFYERDFLQKATLEVVPELKF